MEIAKTLVNMADSLPQIKQCMADVKAKIYVPSNAAVVASGGSLPASTDPATGKAPDIIITPKKLIENNEVLTVPSSTGATTTVTASAETPAATTGDAPAAETNGEEKKEEGAEGAAGGEEAKA